MCSTSKYDIIIPSFKERIFMKTKIIYISGSEIFEVADIRAAFDEVRGTLGLSNDTVLFGVPIDANDSGIATEIKKSENTVPQNTIYNDVNDDKIIPILSVLNTENNNTTFDNNVCESEQPVEDDIQNAKTEYLVTDEIIEIEVPELNEKINENNKFNEEYEVDNEPVKHEFIIEENIELEDIINDEIPESEEEKTLERLLEKMTPLREDFNSKEPIQKKEQINDTEDLTLEQLATEFASSQDEIVIPKKSDNNGKIGKLKNILPFKKAKRENNGLMGDLFGWAGIAANDDEFSMPDFFSNVASKK